MWSDENATLDNGKFRECKRWFALYTESLTRVVGQKPTRSDILKDHLMSFKTMLRIGYRKLRTHRLIRLRK